MQANNHLKRQIHDVISQAEKLKTSQNFEGDYLSFIKYVNEMNAYILKNVDNDMIRKRVSNLPQLHHKRQNISLLIVIFLPYYLTLVYRNYQKKKMALQNIQKVASAYSSIDFLLGK